MIVFLVRWPIDNHQMDVVYTMAALFGLVLSELGRVDGRRFFDLSSCLTICLLLYGYDDDKRCWIICCYLFVYHVCLFETNAVISDRQLCRRLANRHDVAADEPDQLRAAHLCRSPNTRRTLLSMDDQIGESRWRHRIQMGPCRRGAQPANVSSTLPHLPRHAFTQVQQIPPISNHQHRSSPSDWYPLVYAVNYLRMHRRDRSALSTESISTRDSFSKP